MTHDVQTEDRASEPEPVWGAPGTAEVGHWSNRRTLTAVLAALVIAAAGTGVIYAATGSSSGSGPMMGPGGFGGPAGMNGPGGMSGPGGSGQGGFGPGNTGAGSQAGMPAQRPGGQSGGNQDDKRHTPGQNPAKP
ncbi:hypothetical protein [Sciscionella marina]|uniref:hypothetical protein n=1 Tax=Sciscionella marina TaxID=508770 RepID=UPI000365F42D|nr:hypothetical protein [Sciscionella marina]